ncbi:MAG: rRNA pseudouridine synthase [Clostridia bacterium]|nr:rRNA pseudouridine synthase [Clostridia bacterium]
MRLDKLLSHLGIASRSETKALVRGGRVLIAGERANSADAEVPPGTAVTLDGREIDVRLERFLMMNKPAGVLTAAEDRRQKTVMDLLPPACAALGCMPVGRLDKDTTGLLLFTTDGVLAHRLIAPRSHVDKVYIARVDGALTAADASAFAAGIALGDFTALPAELEILSPDTGRVTVREGKYHQVKRMFAARGKPVTALERVAFGPLTLDGGLAPGEYRELNAEETAALYAAAGIRHE